MLSEEEKKAIEWLKNKPDECTNIINSSSYIGNKKAYAKERTNFKTVFNLITKLQKENKEKDKIIYEVAKSNVKLKGYEVEEKYIDTTIRFFTKYVKNLERNPQWRNDKNE